MIEAYIDVLNRLLVTHECGRQTDKQTDKRMDRYFYSKSRAQNVALQKWEGSIVPCLIRGLWQKDLKLENVVIANALQLEAARPTPLTSALFRFNYDPHAKFEVAEPIHYGIIAFLLLIHYAVTLIFDLWPWTFAVYRLWRDETL